MRTMSNQGVVIECRGPEDWYEVVEGNLPISTDHWGVQLRIKRIEQDTVIISCNGPDGWYTVKHGQLPMTSDHCGAQLRISESITQIGERCE